MNIIVCVKQVPASATVAINRDTHTMIREENNSMINPFDLYALEEAVRHKETHGGKITAISMGIPQTEDLLREVVAIGADHAVLLSDIAFAGADTLATAYTLASGIQKINVYDLIICGRQSTDGDTAQVGPSLAEKLGISHVTCVSKIDEISKDCIRCHRLVEDGYEVIEMRLPGLITVVKEINEPRLPSLFGLRRAAKAEIPVWSAADINIDLKLCGISGSPTYVIDTFTPDYHVENEILIGSPEEQAKTAVEKLSEILYTVGAF
ncbi:MAG TPA: electron transfer flavoprotein subunit beta [Ruminococcaceae bacterium]|nr:electron transfer flavoprotein subunit beta [Oscillospiraceae bacterium]